MHNKAFLLLFGLISILACQVLPQNTGNQKVTISPAGTTLIPKTTATNTPATAAPTKMPEQVNFNIEAMDQFADIELKTYQPVPYTPDLDSLPVNLTTLGNPAVIQGLTAQQKQFLSQNGFVVINAGDEQFKDMRREISTRNGQPYYLTTDAAYHALHVSFDELLASLEGEYLRVVLWRLLQTEYEQVNSYMEPAQNTSIEGDVQLSLDYLTVAIKLLYPDQKLDAATEARIGPQIEQIMAYGGKDYSVLIPNFQDDYGAYRPVSHYAGVAELENYFRAMSWLGRVAFKFKDPDEPALIPSRAPLIMTLALREAQISGQPLYQVWMDFHAVINFMVGPSDDPGPMELNALMEELYGPNFGLRDLMDDQKWETFLENVDDLPAPQINSSFASFSAVQAQSRDWRLMGQVFTLDGFIFQNLVFDKVGSLQNPRIFPSGLDVAAAFGSQTAYQVQGKNGATAYLNYDSQMELLQDTIRQQPQEQWLNRFYSAWLYAFLPQVAPKDAHFPPVMRTNAWATKDFNAMLGSWAELKHDTVLYAKMPEMLGGGGPPMSGPAPAYVEPNPDVFYRLAYAATALHRGLYQTVTNWDNLGWHDTIATGDGFVFGYADYYPYLENLAMALSNFGDLAVKELNNETLTAEDFENIQVCLGFKECLDRGAYSNNVPDPNPIPVIAAVAGAENEILEAGVGYLNRIYVAVPLEGQLQIAQGGVFSYYEFTQPRQARLTDAAWIEMLENNPPALPEWAAEFVLPGGQVHDQLAFRIGDVYILTESGYTPPLNMRMEPSTSAEIFKKLDQETYLTIIAGPEKNATGTWWKVSEGWATEDTKVGGWVLENPQWFKRSANLPYEED